MLKKVEKVKPGEIFQMQGTIKTVTGFTRYFRTNQFVFDSKKDLIHAFENIKRKLSLYDTPFKLKEITPVIWQPSKFTEKQLGLDPMTGF